MSLSDRSGICRKTVGAWSGLSGQDTRCTEGSCAVIMDRLAQSRLRPSATAYEQKDNFLVTSWPVILSVFVSLVFVREVHKQHIHTHTKIQTHTQCYFAFNVLSFSVLVFHSQLGFLLSFRQQ